MPTPIGIDLGTTFSVIACYRNGRPEIISDSYSKRLIPSMVYYDPQTGQSCVGQLAYEKSPKCYRNLLTDAKRIIGRKIDDEMIKKWLSHTRFELTETDTGMAAYQVEVGEEKNPSKIIKKPEEVSGEILKYLAEYGSEYLGETIKEAVISVPAHFSVAQRKATIKAAELAGLRVLRLITEPVAGALHYVTDKQIKTKLLVFDFGGGTLDVSLIDVNDQTFEVKAVYGDTMLGGKNIDENLFKYFYVTPKEVNINCEVWRSIRRLEEGCITVKEFLSQRNEFTKYISAYDGNTDLELTMARKTFEKLNENLFQKTIDIVKRCLQNANCKKEDIKQVILLGGSTRIPKIRSLLESYFGSSKIHTDVNADEAVASGACLLAAILSNGFPSLEKYKIREVTGLSLGISGFGDLNCIVIPRNSRLPAYGSKTRRTIDNDQKSVIFPITEGERKNSKYNNELGSFCITDLPQKQAGHVKFNIEFSLDNDGILTVTASEMDTGKHNSLTVTMGEFRLSEHQINFEIQESIRQKEEDDLFEKFMTRRNLLIEICSGWEYKNDDDRIRRKCRDFRTFAKNLDFRQINELKSKFGDLKNEVLGKTPTL